MVKEEKINKDYNLTDFQKKVLSNLYEKNTVIIDFYVDEEDNDLVLYVTDNDSVIECFIICEETDVYFSRIGRHDSKLDKLEKIHSNDTEL